MGHFGSDRVCQRPTRRRTLAYSPARYHAEYEGNDFAGCPMETEIPAALFLGITPSSGKSVPMLIGKRWIRGNWSSSYPKHRMSAPTQMLALPGKSHLPTSSGQNRIGAIAPLRGSSPPAGHTESMRVYWRACDEGLHYWTGR